MTTEVQTIAVDSLVRSYDFKGDKTCYVTGVVERIEERGGCMRYVIHAIGRVWENHPESFDGYVYPPVNGTPMSMGGVANFVELV